MDLDVVSGSLIGQRVFGGYVATRAIGSGGMGEVYLIENIELRKQLVIKVLLAERSTNPQLVARFLAEARAASALQHRNIVEILDSARLPDRRHYILMEYLAGDTLGELMERVGVMAPAEVLAILAQIGSALQAAHDRGIVHRDIKPSNIMITPRPDNRLFAKLLDFGIAKLEDPELHGGIETKSIMVAGTPHYMSPEQARTLRNVDHRTDIYSAGVIAYELLTGKVPYEAHSVGELVFQQANTRPARVSELRPEVPRGWSDLLERALALEPGRRPASMGELVGEMAASTPDGAEMVRLVAPDLAGAGAGAASIPRLLALADAPAVAATPPTSPARAAPSSGALAAATGVRGPDEMTKILRAPKAAGASGASAEPASGVQPRVEAVDADAPTRIAPRRTPRPVADRPVPVADADEPTHIARPGGPSHPGVAGAPGASGVDDDEEEAKTRVVPRRADTDNPTRVLVGKSEADAASATGPAGTKILPKPGAGPAGTKILPKPGAGPAGTKILPKPGAGPAGPRAAGAAAQNTDVLPAGAGGTSGARASAAQGYPTEAIRGYRYDEPSDGARTWETVKWVIAIAVVTGAIAAALAIGLFTGPSQVPRMDRGAPATGDNPPAARPAPSGSGARPSVAPLAEPDAGAPADAGPGDAGPGDAGAR